MISDSAQNWLGGALHMAARVIGIVLGGYVLMSGSMALAGMAINTLGVSIVDAMTIATLVGFLAYIGVVIWGFASPSIFRPLAISLLGFVSVILAILLTPEFLQ